MANKTVSNLKEVTTVSNSDVLLVETSTETLKVTKGNLLKEVNEELNAKSDANHTHDEYVTESELNSKGLATEMFVTNKIAEAQLGNDGGNMDLSGYATTEYVDQEVGKTNAQLSETNYKIDEIKQNSQEKIREIESELAQTNAQLSQKTNESYVNAVAFGIKEGFDVNVEENTRLFQELINHCADSKVIIFPSGNFVFNSVNLGEKRNITIKGASSPFASFAQKNIYTGAFIDEFTKIYCNAPSGETFFNHKSCVLILENIAFYNVKKDSNGNFTQTEAKKNIFMQHTRSEDATKNVEKGKAFCFNTAFYGWKVVFGSDFTFQHLEDEWRTGLVQSEYEYFKQSCVVASRCRFTRNGVAINQSVDGRLVDCSFNKNDYAIVLRENSGFTTISNCRIEWNNYNGIYCDKAHDVTVSNCEFDCNGWAGLYATNNTESNFNGVFRRNGAKIETLEDGSHQNDFTKNVHIYANGNLNCNFIGSNTVVKPISDVGSAPERPSNCSNFTNNKNCVVSLNNLAGCTKKDKTNANCFDGNINCIIDNNILVGRESYPV